MLNADNAITVQGDISIKDLDNVQHVYVNNENVMSGVTVTLCDTPSLPSASLSAGRTCNSQGKVFVTDLGGVEQDNISNTRALILPCISINSIGFYDTKRRNFVREETATHRVNVKY